MFKDIHVGTLSPSLRQGVKERHKTNPTQTYGDLAFRNIVRTGAALTSAVGFLTLAQALVVHDAFTTNLVNHVMQGKEQGFFTNTGNFLFNHEKDLFLHNPLAITSAALAVPGVLTGAVSAPFALWRTGEFVVSLGENVNSGIRKAGNSRTRASSIA